MVTDPDILVLSLTMLDVTHIPGFYTNWHLTEVVFLVSTKHYGHVFIMCTMLKNLHLGSILSILMALDL